MLDSLIRKILSIFPKFIQDFYYKHESLMLYLIVGAMTTVVSLIAQYVPAFLGLPTAVNTTISWVIAVIFAFFANKFWAFKDESTEKSDLIKQASSFLAARLGTYFLELGFMVFTVDVLDQNEYIMKLIAMVLVTIVNYFLSKLFIFRKKSDPEAAEPEEEKIDV
ncbi:MAG: GtrA family protein [Oscillospiraceae bacterium]|nr:GtrA family protein [Oscillospiraceae bacterium]